MSDNIEPKSGEVVIETKTGPVRMMLSSIPKTTRKVATNWKPILVALSAVGVAVLGYVASWINAKADELKANEDPTDISILQLRDKVDTISNVLTEHRLDEAKEIGELRTKLALAEQTISWLRKKASTTASTGTEPTPVMLAPAPVALAHQSQF